VIRINEKPSEDQSIDYPTVRDYYNQVYYRQADLDAKISRHLHRLAIRFQPWQGKRLLDVGCGSGGWLRAASASGAHVTGVDLSEVALAVCRQSLPDAALCCSPAEHLPFVDSQFDFISCLGSLEHFLNPEVALKEMIRVAKPSARFLILVPNSGFLLRRLGLYSGTEQIAVREAIRCLQGWQELFESVGMMIDERWKDLHVLSASWMIRGPWHLWPARVAQALLLPLWPLAWQYQVYHLCRLS